MPRRGNDSASDNDFPKKKSCPNPKTSSFDLKHGEFLKDITGKQWKLGKAVGVGGFGEIYLASDILTKEVETDCKYVAKVESHKNGPLFVEMNCYLRIAKSDMIEEWKKEKKLSRLGMPHYVASGSHIHNNEKYRFLILPKFDKDLEKVLQEKKMLNLKTVLTISIQIMDVLEYIHSKGYIHSDIKASNILLSNSKVTKKTTPVRKSSRYNYGNHYGYNFRSCKIKKTSLRPSRNLRRNAVINYFDDIPGFDEILAVLESEPIITAKEESQDQIYLLDYGLASKFLTSSGEHKPYCIDERKAHAGTILFCSRDAHKGVPSRRSDLESLGYNIIYWLTGDLPWSRDIDNPEIVAKKKQRAMSNIEYFMQYCFSEYPKFLEEYFKYIQKLEFKEKPNYDYCKRLFRQALTDNGFKNDSCFDFDNVVNLMSKPIKVKRRNIGNLHTISRIPLQSNIPVKPLLRKKVKDKKLKKKTNWFEEMPDPEEILKQAREKKSSENNDCNIADLNIHRLNPTYAMLEVYNKCIERGDSSPSYKGDSCAETLNGYTHAMMSVLQKINKRKEIEQLAVNLTNNRTGKVLKKKLGKRNKKYESPVKSPPKPKTTKSALAMKKDVHLRKLKIAMRRTYSLKG